MAELLISLFVSALVSSALSLASSFIFGQETPTEPVAATPGADETQSATGALAVRPEPGGPVLGVFGHRRLGGRVALSEKSNGKTYLAIVIASGPVTGVNALYVNNNIASLDASGNVLDFPWQRSSNPLPERYAINVRFYTGSQIAADPELVAAFPGWTADHVGLETTYARIILNPDAVNLSVPAALSSQPDFTFDVSGFACYDPRDPAHDISDRATWTYSGNAAIIEANYLVHSIGHNLPTDRVDWAAYAEAANIDDELIPLAAGGTEPRHQCAAFWRGDEKHEDVLSRIGACRGGKTHMAGNKYVPYRANYADPHHNTITPNDYAPAGLTFNETPPIESIANGVRGTFSSPLHHYEDRDFPARQDPAALAEDGTEHWLDLAFPFVTSHTQAQRLALIAYRRNRHGFTAEVACKFWMFDVVAGDAVALTDEYAGFAEQTFRVNTDGLEEDYTVRLKLTHEAAWFFDWDEATDELEFTGPDALTYTTDTIARAGFAIIDGAIYFGSTHPAGGFRGALVTYPSATPAVDRYTLINSAPTASTVTLPASPVPVFEFVRTNEANTLLNNNLFSEISGIEASTTGAGLASATTGTAAKTTTLATTTNFTLPEAGTPRFVTTAPGSGAVHYDARLDVAKIDEVNIWEGSDQVFASATNIYTGAAVAGSVAVSGAPGEAKFYWVQYRNVALNRLSLQSRPLLVVF